MRISALGGWSAWNFNVSEAAQKIFDSAMEGLIGVEYAPLAFATRSTPTDNYAFICKGEPVSPLPDKIDFLALLNITSEAGRDSSLLRIQRVRPVATGNPGGYSNWEFPASSEAMKALEEGQKDLGVHLETYASSTQVIEGINHACFTKVTPLDSLSAKVGEAAVATVYVFPNKEAPPLINGFETIHPDDRYHPIADVE